MQINEYDDQYYDAIQGILDYHKDQARPPERDHYSVDKNTDTEMEIGDWIISKYEAGEISFKEAEQELIKKIGVNRQLQFWLYELMAAQDMIGH